MSECGSSDDWRPFDDTPAKHCAELAILKDQYRTRVATSGAKALEQTGPGTGYRTSDLIR